jgi:ribosomal protein S28E/S33
MRSFNGLTARFIERNIKGAIKSQVSSSPLSRRLRGPIPISDNITLNRAA